MLLHFILQQKLDSFSPATGKTHPYVWYSDVEDLGRIEPDSGIVFFFCSANCLRYCFTHDASGVPYLLLPLFGREVGFEFSTISDRVTSGILV
jgi:hypothetical protein